MTYQPPKQTRVLRQGSIASPTNEPLLSMRLHIHTPHLGFFITSCAMRGTEVQAGVFFRLAVMSPRRHKIASSIVLKHGSASMTGPGTRARRGSVISRSTMESVDRPEARIRSNGDAGLADAIRFNGGQVNEQNRPQYIHVV